MKMSCLFFFLFFVLPGIHLPSSGGSAVLKSITLREGGVLSLFDVSVYVACERVCCV